MWDQITVIRSSLGYARTHLHHRAIGLEHETAEVNKAVDNSWLLCYWVSISKLATTVSEIIDSDGSTLLYENATKHDGKQFHQDIYACLY